MFTERAWGVASGSVERDSVERGLQPKFSDTSGDSRSLQSLEKLLSKALAHVCWEDVDGFNRALLDAQLCEPDNLATVFCDEHDVFRQRLLIAFRAAVATPSSNLDRGVVIPSKTADRCHVYLEDGRGIFGAGAAEHGCEA